MTVSSKHANIYYYSNHYSLTRFSNYSPGLTVEKLQTNISDHLTGGRGLHHRPRLPPRHVSLVKLCSIRIFLKIALFIFLIEIYRVFPRSRDKMNPAISQRKVFMNVLGQLSSFLTYGVLKIKEEIQNSH